MLYWPNSPLLLLRVMSAGTVSFRLQQDRPVTQTLSLILLKLGERGGRRESKEGKELRKSGSLTAVLAKLL